MRSGQVELLEVLEGHVTGARLVTFCDEVHDVGVCRREGKELGENGFDLLVGDELTITFVKEAEALLGLFISAGLGADAFVPAVCDDVANEREIHAVALKHFWVTLLELILDIARAHLVEAEVLDNVLKQMFGDGTLVLLQIVVEAFLEVGGHLRRQVADINLLRRLCTVLDLRGLSGCLYFGHFLVFSNARSVTEFKL